MLRRRLRNAGLSRTLPLLREIIRVIRGKKNTVTANHANRRESARAKKPEQQNHRVRGPFDSRQTEDECEDEYETPTPEALAGAMQ